MYNELFEDYRNEYVHLDDLPDMKEMKKRMNNILNIVYGESDVEDLEIELEELASHFEINLPAKAFKLTRS